MTILSQLDHPNILKIYEYFEDEAKLYIVTELCTGGELFDRIIENGKLTEADACVVMKQLLSSVAFCHELNIVHRDLKPENVIFVNDEQESPIKLIDFGLSTQTAGGMTKKIGTVKPAKTNSIMTRFNIILFLLTISSPFEPF